MIDAILTFYAIIEVLFSSLIPCLALEKAFSMLQGRKFNMKFVWAIWLIAFFAPSLIGQVASTVGQIYEQRNMSFIGKVELRKKTMYNSS